MNSKIEACATMSSMEVFLETLQMFQGRAVYAKNLSASKKWFNYLARFCDMLLTYIDKQKRLLPAEFVSDCYDGLNRAIANVSNVNLTIIIRNKIVNLSDAEDEVLREWRYKMSRTLRILREKMDLYDTKTCMWAITCLELVGKRTPVQDILDALTCISKVTRRSGDLERRSGDLERRSGDLERRSGDLERRSGDLERRSGDLERRSGDLERNPTTISETSACILTFALVDSIYAKPSSCHIDVLVAARILLDTCKVASVRAVVWTDDATVSYMLDRLIIILEVLARIEKAGRVGATAQRYQAELASFLRDNPALVYAGPDRGHEEIVAKLFEDKDDFNAKEDKKLQAHNKKSLQHSELECIVCQDAIRDTVFIPCGHVICCWDCVQRMRSRSMHACPMCCQHIDDDLRLHF
jgi:hypothetical protein